MDDEQTPNPVRRRTDVGYKRPPVEHQFKTGQTPPPRKRNVDSPLTGPRLLAKILAEERRFMRGKRVIWTTNGALLVEIAFQLSEAGSRAARRALAALLLAKEEPHATVEEPRMELDPDGPGGVFYYARRVKV